MKYTYNSKLEFFDPIATTVHLYFQRGSGGTGITGAISGVTGARMEIYSVLIALLQEYVGFGRVGLHAKSRINYCFDGVGYEYILYASMTSVCNR